MRPIITSISIYEENSKIQNLWEKNIFFYTKVDCIFILDYSALQKRKHKNFSKGQNVHFQSVLEINVYHPSDNVLV